MKSATSKHQKVIFLDNDILKYAEHFTSITPVTKKSTDEVYEFRKYLFIERWGICNADKTKKILDCKYITVEILVDSQLLVGNNADLSWDVFSLDGKLLMTTPPMSLGEVTSYLAKMHLS